MFLLPLRTHESMAIQFSINGIHQKWPYCLPTWDQKVISDPFSLGLGLSLKTITYKIPVSDSVSKLRLGKIESPTRSRNWDSEIYSLRLGLEIETQKIWVSDPVSKLRHWKFQSRTRSRNVKVGLADPCGVFYVIFIPHPHLKTLRWNFHWAWQNIVKRSYRHNVRVSYNGVTIDNKVITIVSITSAR